MRAKISVILLVLASAVAVVAVDDPNWPICPTCPPLPCYKFCWPDIVCQIPCEGTQVAVIPSSPSTLRTER